jgi:hypothetical protein
MTLEFQQIFSTLYVTAPKLIRHVPPLAPLREFLDDDDRPRTYGGREKGHQFVKFGSTLSSHMPNNVIALMADASGCGGSRA